MVSLKTVLLALWMGNDVESAGEAIANPFDLLAKTLFKNGESLFNEGRYDDAIFAWKQAWKLSNRPLLLYNIAYAQEKKGDLELAIDSYYRYRALAPIAEQPSLIAKIKSLKAIIQTEKQALQETKTTTDMVLDKPKETTEINGFTQTWQHDPTYLWTSIGLMGISGLGTAWLNSQHSETIHLIEDNCQESIETTLICNGDSKTFFNSAEHYRKGIYMGYILTGISLFSSIYFGFHQFEQYKGKQKDNHSVDSP